MRILGIDPGFGRIGWGIIEFKKGEWIHIAHGCVETYSKDSFARRLIHIEQSISELIKMYQPTVAGVEELFFYKNVTTAVHVGHARGVILLTLSHHNVPIHEYTPLQVKSAITGYGRADKKQMQVMIQMQLGLRKKIHSDDAADALAVALTCGVIDGKSASKKVRPENK